LRWPHSQRGSQFGLSGRWYSGRLGDLVGRKHTFLITMSLMGIATFAVGVLPSYATAGGAAPVMLLALRSAARIGTWG